MNPQYTDQSFDTSQISQLFASRNLNLPANLGGEEALNLIESLRSAPTVNDRALYDQSTQMKLINGVFPTNYYRTEEKRDDKRKLELDPDKLSKDEAKQIFKNLLKEVGVTATWKWDDASRILQDDERVKVIKHISDRKAAFNDYIADCKAKERNDARQKRQIMKESFEDLLRESKFLNPESKFKEVVKFLMPDIRFRTIDERDREEIFQEYIDQLEKRDRDDKREMSKRKTENLKSLFFERRLPSDLKWAEVCEMFQDDPLFNSTEPLEQLIAFTEFVKYLEREEYDDKKRTRRYKERKNREAFRQFLEDKFKNKEISLKTKWKDFANSIKDYPVYYDMVGQPGSTPKELFDDLIEKEKENFRRQKGTLKQIIKDNNIQMSSQTTFEEFDKNLTNFPEYTSIEGEYRKFLHDYFLNKIKEKEKDKLRKFSKGIRRFESMLKTLKDITPISKFEDFEGRFGENRNFALIPDAEKRRIFDEYKLNPKEKESGSSDDEPGAIKKSKNKKKRKSKKRVKETDPNEEAESRKTKKHKREKSKRRRRSKSPSSSSSRGSESS